MSVTRGPAAALLAAFASLTLAATASAAPTLKSTPPVPLPSAPAARSGHTVEPKPVPARPQATGSLPRTGLDTSLEALAGSLLLALGVSVRIATAPPS